MHEYYGSCHCQAVRFKFISTENIEIWKCNCSICSLSDFEHLFVKHDDFILLNGEEKLISYKFGTKNANHLFCKSCGVKSFYQPRSHPEMYSVNLKCVKNPPKVKKCVDFDGKNFEDSIKEI